MAEVSLTVNGTPVTLEVEPRLTLVDGLRHGLRLTGTHVGCEHGVCGACTVLVDGAAARSCLLYCVALEGAEIVTVEALGDADELHPLQEAFRRHHGLQCGFCTPGFLMSAYELLRTGGIDADDEAALRAELSGVLCRCTGYAGILAAVQDVARTHADGLPGPGALGRPLVVRNGTGVGGAEDAALAQADELAAQAGAPAAGGAADAAAAETLSVPPGEPNETIDVSTSIDSSPAETWQLLRDFPTMSRLLPGVDLGRDLGDDRYEGHARVHLGPMRLAFSGAAQVIERDDERHVLRAIAAGRDTSGGGVRADLTLSAEASEAGDGGGTRVRAQVRLFLSGRAAQFGRSLAGDVSRQLFAEFGRGVERTLATGEVAAPARLRGGALAWSLLRARLAGLRRLRG